MSVSPRPVTMVPATSSPDAVESDRRRLPTPVDTVTSAARAPARVWAMVWLSAAPPPSTPRGPLPW